MIIYVFVDISPGVINTGERTWTKLSPFRQIWLFNSWIKDWRIVDLLKLQLIDTKHFNIERASTTCEL